MPSISATGSNPYVSPAALQRQERQQSSRQAEQTEQQVQLQLEERRRSEQAAVPQANPATQALAAELNRQLINRNEAAPPNQPVEGVRDAASSNTPRRSTDNTANATQNGNAPVDNSRQNQESRQVERRREAERPAQTPPANQQAVSRYQSEQALLQGEGESRRRVNTSA